MKGFFRLWVIAAACAVSIALGNPVRADEETEATPPPSAPAPSDDFFGDAHTSKDSFQPIGKLTGELWEKFAVDTQKNNDDEFLYSSLAVIFPEASFTMRPDLSVKMSALLTHDFSFNETEHSGEYAAQLWEAYAKYKIGPVDLFAGQKLWTWGQTDIISPTDLINPIDLNRLIDPEIKISRLPVFSLGAAWYFSGLHLEGVCLPFFRAARFDVVGRDTAILGHRFPLYDLLRTIDDDASYRRSKRFLDRWWPDWQEDIQEKLDDPDLYGTRLEDMEDDFTNAAGALRFGGSRGGWDFNLNGYYLWDQTPTVYFNPKLIGLLNSARDREDQYSVLPSADDLTDIITRDPFRAVNHRIYGPGLDIGTTFGAVSVRAETTAIFNRRTYQDDFEPVIKPVYTYAVNVEYTFPYDVLVSGTLIHSFLGDYTPDLIARPSYAYLFLVWRTTFFRDRLNFQGAVTYDFGLIEEDQWTKPDLFQQDGQISPFLDWAVTDPFHVGTGANLFWGDSDSLFGYLKEKSRVFVFTSYKF